MKSLFLDFSTFSLEKIKSTEDDYFDSVLDFTKTFFDTTSEFEVQTSGSTGMPKKIQISKKAAITSATLSNQYFNITNESVLLLPLNINFIGAKMLLIRAIVAKAKIYVIHPKVEIEFDKTISIDMVSVSTIQLNWLIENNLSLFNNCKKCLIGGGAVSNFLKEKIYNLNTECEFYESFAMTETISHFAIKSISKKDENFTLLSDFDITVNENNELVVYHSEITKNPIVTNDLVEIYPDNTFKWIGRSNFTINTSGLKVQPEELENQLSSLISDPFIISSIDDDITGEKVVLIVHNPSLVEEQYQSFISKTISPNAIQPKEIFFIDKWHTTQNGKPDRIAIKNEIKK